MNAKTSASASEYESPSDIDVALFKWGTKDRSTPGVIEPQLPRK
jgi:hypothetical protein